MNPIDWIDEYIERVKPYIWVRQEDNLLIKRPNQATHLNNTGTKVLKYLLDGGSINSLLDKAGKDKENDIVRFIVAVRLYLEGKLDTFTVNPAVEKEVFDMNFSDYPVLSELAITYRCNLSCKFCYAGCNETCNPAGSDKELGYDDLCKIIDKIRHEALVPSISFTGGEPTLRKSLLIRLIEYAKENDFRVNLITNGTLVDKQYATDLKMAGLDSAQVSLEGVTKATHDGLVRKQGAFEKTLAAVNNLKGAGIFTHTNTTITRENLHEIQSYPNFVSDKLHLERFSMNLQIPTGSSSVFNENTVTYNEIGKHLEALLEESRQQNVEFMWYSPVPMCMFNSILHGLGNKGCSACDGLLSVAPNGDVLPCASYDDPVGNLLNSSFKSIWHNIKCTHYRNKGEAHEFCKGCKDFRFCNGACPLYWRSQGYGELEEIIKNQLQTL